MSCLLTGFTLKREVTRPTGDTPEVHAFGQFRFDRGQRRLARDGVALVLGRRALNVPGVLLAANGAVGSKDQLLAEAWPELTVDQNNLQVQVSALRKAPGDGWIVTSQGRGYRLTGQAEVPRPGIAHIFSGRRSIAVLPFTTKSERGVASIAAGPMLSIAAGIGRAGRRQQEHCVQISPERAHSTPQRRPPTG